MCRKCRRQTKRGTLAFGTVESWLVFKLTAGSGGYGAHITDASNASRTLLMGLEDAQFDEGLCDLIGVPLSALPGVTDMAGPLAMTDPSLFGGAIPITGLAGDQQAATIGQACLAPGQTKATYGTGAFVLTCQGSRIPRSTNRLLGTVLTQLDANRTYAIEGSVFVAGSLVQWLRDSLGIVDVAEETEALARSIPDSGGGGDRARARRTGARRIGGPMRAASSRGSALPAARPSWHARRWRRWRIRPMIFAPPSPPTALLGRRCGSMAAWRRMTGWRRISPICWGSPSNVPALSKPPHWGAAMLAATGAGLYDSLDEAAGAMRGRAGAVRAGDGCKRARRTAGALEKGARGRLGYLTRYPRCAPARAPIRS